MSSGDPWSRYIDEPWLSTAAEPVIAPELAIIDSHHHLMSWPLKYEINETLADACSGHTVRATVHVEAHGHYRNSGPEHLYPVGETEYLAGVLRELDPSTCSTNLCAGIVGYADVMRGSAVDEVLAAHLEAAQGRFRGVRVNLYWNMSREDPWTPSEVRSLLDTAPIRAALDCLARRELSCDLVAFHSNLPDVARTARALDRTVFIVNHLGGPMTADAHPDEQALSGIWRSYIDELALVPNVRMKLGGWLNPMLSRSIPSVARLRSQSVAPSSSQLATALRPYVEYAIERFGPSRCMFESNFPMDKNFAHYSTLWNAYKRLASQYSIDEQTSLLAGTAARTYRLH